MNLPPLPPWPTDASTAIALQKTLASHVSLEDRFDKIETIAGIDCSYDINNDISYAVIVTMKLENLQPCEIIRAQAPTTFPYISGLLSFREIPVILKALQILPKLPDLLMVDGQGIAHPRRLGIAAHLGVLLDWPTIGVAKSLLTGHYQEPGLRKGDITPLLDKKNNQQIGTVLRSKDNVKPLFISPGHRISQQTALDLTRRCLIKHRLPEPTRIADKISKDKQGFSEDKSL